MPYSTQDEVEMWGRFTSADLTSGVPSNWGYPTQIQEMIRIADGKIDDYMRVPGGFFNAGGVWIEDEYHSGKLLPGGGKKPLRPAYTPILHNLTKKLEYYQNGAWTAKTEGIASDYQVTETEFILIAWPNTTEYKNIRISYRAGYEQTPTTVSTTSARLAAAIGQLILDAKNRRPTTVGVLSDNPPRIHMLTDKLFTKELKEDLHRFKLEQVKVYRG